ncbi:MAG: F-type H+-transporting ATPase subunit b [Limisphaerales bacterium]|jgi:F-type H+-transporting ATPase subunit b
MALLANAFSLITPDFGLFFWTLITFCLLWFILGKYAFGPIGKSLKERADKIEGSLRLAEKAREEMSSLQSDHERMKAEAAEERSKIIQIARKTSNDIVEEARVKAKAEADRIVAAASDEIENKKMAAIIEVKNKVGVMSLDIAEKILRRELSNKSDQEGYVSSLVDEFNAN